MYHRRNTPKNTIFHSAGWLFADLLLALTIIFIAASAAGKPVVKAHPPVTPVPTLTPAIQGIETNYTSCPIFVDPQQLQLHQPEIIAQAKNQVNQCLTKNHRSKSLVGFVLNFGGGYDGENNARTFDQTVLLQTPPFDRAVLRYFHDLRNPPNEFFLEIHFFS